MFKNKKPSGLPLILGIVGIAALSAFGLSLLTGLMMRTVQLYGFALFLGIPILIGFLPAAALRTMGSYRLAVCNAVAFATGLVLVLRVLLLRWEGLICIALASPLEIPLIVLGAALAHSLFHNRSVRPVGPGAAVIVVISGLFVSESHDLRPGPSFVKDDSVVIHATPERVWREIVHLERVPAPSGWLLRTGIACPQTVRIPRPGQGGTRLCMLSTGPILERIEVWEPGRLLRWRALATPPPMREVNPFGAVDAPHLHGFFEAFEGEFAIEAAAPGITRLTRRTWYRLDLQPAAYWRFWCDLGAHQAHELVLQEIQRLAELPAEQ